jgi:PTS system nitrogen regulatory IIA component
MKIADFLSPDHVLLNVETPSKRELMHTLCQMASADLGVPVDEIFQKLQAREQLGSTGIGQGIALPHARLETIKRPFGAVARLKKPIDFEAIDGQPVDLVFLLLLPTALPEKQLNALATVARALRDAKIVERARHATNATDLYRVVTYERTQSKA